MLKSNRLVRGAILGTSIMILTPWLGRGQVAPEALFGSPAFVQESFGARAFLGVGVREVDGERAKALNLKEEYGVEVIRVEAGSPAESAGIKNGDVVLSYNGQRVEGTEQFVRFVRETPPGRTVKLSVVRDGAQQIISVPLGTRKAQAFGPSTGELHVEVPEMPEMDIPMPDIPRAMMSWRNSVLGVEAEALGDTQLAAYFGVKDGVLVRSVAKGTAAEKAGLKAGDVLLKVDNEHVSSPRDVTNSMREARSAGKKTLPIALMRERKELTVSVTLEDPQMSAPKPRASQANHSKL
jgi:serine protease Do